MITAHHIYTAKKAMFTALAVWLAAYVFVILLTYSPNDPSWSHISSDMGQISNMGGAIGAWIADLLYTFFGWSSWWIIVFIAYEAVSIWWQREQAFGLFRVIAYFFLALATSGMVAIIPVLLALGETSASIHGGILGFELANRLSRLLTVYGASLFLAVFAVLTATFAFDVHWRKLFRHIVSLSWLGAGVKDARYEGRTDYADHQDKNAIDGSDQMNGEALNSLSKDTDDSLGTPLNKGLNKGLNSDLSNTEVLASADGSPIFEQLALQLSKHTDELNTDGFKIGAACELEPNRQVENNDVNDPALSNVLNEFLVNSGLGESILNLQQQEAEDKRLDAEVQSQGLKTNHDAAQAKQAPSFAWNDPNAIDQLLNQNEKTASADLDQPTSAVNTNTSINDRAEAMIDTKHADSHSRSEATSHTGFTSEDTPENILKSNSDTQAISKPSSPEQHSPESSNIELSNIEPSSIELSSSDSYSNDLYSSESSSFEVEKSWQADTQESDALEVSSAHHRDDNIGFNEATIDLMPTNTPPSNPAKPHEVEPKSEISSTVTPPIRFATPEGDASNHIEDMVPDDDYDPAHDPEQARLDKIMPEIHDDSAFASSSRAMQTAKYRSHLSPLPEMSILDKPDPDKKPSYTQEELKQLSELLEIKLQEFNVKAEVVNAIPGPVVTRFEVELAAGVKASKVTGISRDLARSLSMASLRVVEVIPGKPYIGIEVPNKKREMVRLIELLSTEKYKDPNAQISMAMGKDIGGKPIITDLARAPHMLVAGTTGSGKSVLVNSMLLSMLLKYKPSELRLILIDPKQLELANYNDIPHLLTPVVTDMNEAASSLSWCVAEMERRYQLMSLLKVRKLGEFNKKVIAAEKAGKPIIDPLWRPNESVSIDKAPKLKTLPMIVIVADEFADMIMQVGKQAEELITRLAQKSRAAGIHLMLATQRPSVDVITGLIKANIPVRAALRVNSKVDSRTILDAGGAEDMLGNGDMLFLGPGQIEPDRVHGAYVSDEEVNRVCDAWRERGAPDYIENMASNFELSSPTSGSSAGNSSGEDDSLYDEAVAFVMETRKVSASSIQRKFSIGYNRAARIVDSMEEAGLVSSMGKSGKRELLM